MIDFSFSLRKMKFFVLTMLLIAVTVLQNQNCLGYPAEKNTSYDTQELNGFAVDDSTVANKPHLDESYENPTLDTVYFLLANETENSTATDISESEIAHGIKSKLKDIADKVGNKAKDIAGKVKDKVKDVFDKVKDKFGKGKNKIKEGGNDPSNKNRDNRGGSGGLGWDRDTGNHGRYRYHKTTPWPNYYRQGMSSGEMGPVAYFFIIFFAGIVLVVIGMMIKWHIEDKKD